MINVADNIIQTLEYLMPGFISAWIFHALTPYPQASAFERVVQALIFTTIIQVLAFLASLYWKISTEEMWLLLSVGLALALGLLFAFFANNDAFHWLLRQCKITRSTSYASEWFSALSQNTTYVTLHLENGQRIYGWPTDWPIEPEKGHFLITEVSWLDANGKEMPMSDVESILVDAGDVKLVQFSEQPPQEKQNAQ